LTARLRRLEKDRREEPTDADAHGVAHVRLSKLSYEEKRDGQGGRRHQAMSVVVPVKIAASYTKAHI
jgi:hypothetical protein